MKCPQCGSDNNYVIDSRPSTEYGVRRRRECNECGKRFTTYEITLAEKAKYEQIRLKKEQLERKIRAFADAL